MAQAMKLASEKCSFHQAKKKIALRHQRWCSTCHIHDFIEPHCLFILIGREALVVSLPFHFIDSVSLFMKFASSTISVAMSLIKTS